jgi:hypothetical protein
MAPDLTTPDAIRGLALALARMRHALQRDLLLSIAVIGEGSYSIDTASERLVAEGWLDRNDLGIVCDHGTLVSMLTGEPLGAPGVFLWSGGRELLERIAQRFKPATSLLTLRAGGAP